jgi:hypothetical protein
MSDFSLVVKLRPEFPGSMVASRNHEISDKFQHILKSYLKLATGISRTPVLVMYASDGGMGESFARYEL